MKIMNFQRLSYRTIERVCTWLSFIIVAAMLWAFLTYYYQQAFNYIVILACLACSVYLVVRMIMILERWLRPTLMRRDMADLLRALFGDENIIKDVGNVKQKRAAVSPRNDKGQFQKQERPPHLNN